jgi:hypothetical protein
VLLAGTAEARTLLTIAAALLTVATALLTVASVTLLAIAATLLIPTALLTATGTEVIAGLVTALHTIGIIARLVITFTVAVVCVRSTFARLITTRLIATLTGLIATRLVTAFTGLIATRLIAASRLIPTFTWLIAAWCTLLTLVSGIAICIIARTEGSAFTRSIAPIDGSLDARAHGMSLCAIALFSL